VAVDDLASQIRHVLKLWVEREHRFHPTRRWRFDLALIPQRVAVEVDGGSFVAGRHSRGAGQRGDMEKYGEALKLGWIVVRCMPEHVESGAALSWVEAALAARPGGCACREGE
jgi:very-short-patch-repair endonuclease